MSKRTLDEIATSRPKPASHAIDGELELEDHLDENQQDNDLTSQATSRGPLARIACNSCRSRKSKCDEQKPVCSTCQNLALTCVYGKPRRPRLEVVLENISKSLIALELKSDKIALQLAPVSNQTYECGVQLSTDSSEAALTWQARSLPHDLSSSPQSWNSHPYMGESDGLGKQNYHPDRYMKFEGLEKFQHATAAQKIYTWPCLQHVVAGMDPDYPINSELSREPLQSCGCIPFCLSMDLNSSRSALGTDTMTVVQIRQLLNYYFQDLYLLYPVLDKEEILQTSLPKLLENGIRDDGDSCTMLLIFALGSLAAYQHGQTEWGHEGMQVVTAPVGLMFFNSARRILPFLSRGKCQTAQCYILTGLYYSQVLRIHDFWFSIHEAAAIILSIFSVKSPRRCTPDIVRSFWVAYILESNITAELDLPKSDLAHFEDIVPLPFGDGQEVVAHANYQFVFLAHIALRRLLNRILQNIYGIDQTNDLAPDFSNVSSSLISELNSQLDNWLGCIPPALSASFRSSLTLSSTDPAFYQYYPDNLLGQIKGRYWAARFVIHRPFVFKALHSRPDALTEEDLKGVEECLTAGMNIPLQMGIMTEKPWLIASPFGPIRSFMATYTLICACLDNESLASFATPRWEVIDKMRRKIEKDFLCLSPILKEDFARMSRHRSGVRNLCHSPAFHALVERDRE